jgi:hypothetical protein
MIQLTEKQKELIESFEIVLQRTNGYGTCCCKVNALLTIADDNEISF